jgi:hypothetical protein
MEAVGVASVLASGLLLGLASLMTLLLFFGLLWLLLAPRVLRTL